MYLSEFPQESFRDFIRIFLGKIYGTAELTFCDDALRYMPYRECNQEILQEPSGAQAIITFRIDEKVIQNNASGKSP